MFVEGFIIFFDSIESSFELVQFVVVFFVVVSVKFLGGDMFLNLCFRFILIQFLNHLELFLEHF
jgi:hypothetical protein